MTLQEMKYFLGWFLGCTLLCTPLVGYVWMTRGAKKPGRATEAAADANLPVMAAPPLPGDEARVAIVRLRGADSLTPVQARQLEILEVLQQNRFRTQFVKETTHNGVRCAMHWTADRNGLWLMGEMWVPDSVAPDRLKHVVSLGLVGAIPRDLVGPVLRMVLAGGEFSSVVDGFAVSGAANQSFVRVTIAADQDRH